MELAGLVVGVVGLVVPAYQAVHELAQHVQAMKNFPRKLRNINSQVALQKKLFDNECILLFSSEFDEQVVREMLMDKYHVKWSDPQFQTRFREHLGEFFGESLMTPFQIIKETADQLEAEIRKVTVEKESKPGTLKYAKGMYRKLQRPTEVPHLDALIGTLRNQISDLRLLRQQRAESLKQRHKMAKLKASTTPDKIADQLPGVIEVQKASKRVYSAISAVANCSCHNFYFQLQLSPPGMKNGKLKGPEEDEENSSRTAEDNLFRLVLTQDDNGDVVSCTSVVVRKDSSSESPVSSAAAPPPYSLLPPQEAATVSKKLRFAEDSASSDPFSPTLTDLCSTLRTVSITASHSSYLGALPGADAHRHLYTESLKPAVSRLSLPRVFERASQSRVRSILPLVRKLKLAWTLSASLLRFSFNTALWFRPNWRSGDIYFITESEARLEPPHIAVGFQPAKLSGTCLAKNEQLYSLAIALIEIAYSATLQEIITETYGSEGEWNHVREYTGAKSLVESREIEQRMGRRYQMVVNRCFYCSFTVNEMDLTPATLQRAFYEEVECELKACLSAFLGEQAA